MKRHWEISVKNPQKTRELEDKYSLRRVKEHVICMQRNETAKYEDMIDHRSYTHSLSSCKIEACEIKT